MSKILYAASNMQHINNFHIPYIERLRAEGHTVKVMASGSEADFDIPFVKKMLSPKNFFVRRKIKRVLRDEKFDAVILNTTLAAFHIRLAMPKKHRPRVLNFVHGYLFYEKQGGLKKKLLLFCEKLLAKKTDMIAVMNKEDMRIATENKLCLGEIIMTRGMGARVAEERHSPEKVRQYLDARDEYLMCFVGELSERKNQRFLICALPEIKIAEPKAALLFVGTGSEEMRLRALADRLGVSDSVHFAGQKSNPCDFIRASNLYVSASEIEGMPFNIIEALGCGLPILASDIKGHADLIENESEGVLYERASVADFAEKAKLIISGKLNTDKTAQREKYEKYSFDSVFEETYSVLKDFIK